MGLAQPQCAGSLRYRAQRLYRDLCPSNGLIPIPQYRSILRGAFHPAAIQQRRDCICRPDPDAGHESLGPSIHSKRPRPVTGFNTPP